MVSTPSAPTPEKASNVSSADQSAQTGTAIAQTALNNANEVSTYGTVNYDETGSITTQDANGNDIRVPRYTRTTTLSEGEQGIYDRDLQLRGDALDTGQGLLNNMNDTFSHEVDTSNFQELPEYDRQHYEDALMGRMNPQIERDREAMDARLANQGVTAGSEAYREAHALSDRSANDARYGAILNAGQYAGQEIGAASGIRNQQLQEAIGLRNQSLNELNGFRTGNQVNSPQFQNYQGGRIQPTNVSQNYANEFNQQMQSYNANQASSNGMMGGLFSLGSSLLRGGMMMSNPLLKQDISPASDFLDKVNTLEIKSWRYSPAAQRAFNLDDDLHIGPMADDWAERFGGDGQQISTIDMFGVLFKSVQEMSAKMEALENAQ